MRGSTATARSTITQSWNEHARLTCEPKRATAHEMTLPAGACSNSAARAASSSRSISVSIAAATSALLAVALVRSAGRGAALRAGPGCRADRPLIYMTNQIRFSPFSYRGEPATDRPDLGRSPRDPPRTPDDPPHPVTSGPPLYPVGLVVRGRRCLVVGGGRVGARKVAGLLACGATVTLVAPEAHVAVAHLVEGGHIQAIE